MNCPKCHSDQIEEQTENVSKWPKYILVFFVIFGISYLHDAGLIIGAFVGIIILVLLPKTKIIGVCKDCGNIFTIKYNKEKIFDVRK